MGALSEESMKPNWIVLTIPEECHSIFVCADEGLFDERTGNGLVPLYDSRKLPNAPVPCFIAYAVTSDLSHLDILAGIQKARQE